jgi:hypothetical protein
MILIDPLRLIGGAPKRSFYLFKPRGKVTACTAPCLYPQPVLFPLNSRMHWWLIQSTDLLWYMLCGHRCIRQVWFSTLLKALRLAGKQTCMNTPTPPRVIIDRPRGKMSVSAISPEWDYPR